ncbi:myosin head, motor domain-containing protein, partial [Baffinella frigidus]
NLAAERKPQAVVISGESGAGKTKSAREVLRYIVQVSAGALDGGEAADAALKTNGFAEQMVKKITQNNPILEAFGNAKTLRNDNSSRFGKYLELWFDSGGGNAVAGAQIRTYLLEKSRITARNKGERSFHVFYMLLRGLEKDGSMRELLRLKPLKDYAYLGGAEGTFEAESAYEDGKGEAEQWGTIKGHPPFFSSASLWTFEAESAYEDGKGEAEQWGTLKAALEEMGMGEDILSILRVLSLVLLLGNIQFEETEDHNGSKWSRVARGNCSNWV